MNKQPVYSTNTPATTKRKRRRIGEMPAHLKRELAEMSTQKKA